MTQIIIKYCNRVSYTKEIADDLQKAKEIGKNQF